MRADDEISKLIDCELYWTPDLDSSTLTLAVHEGIVYLGGFVREEWDKYRAQHAAERVVGSGCITNDIAVSGAQRKRPPASKLNAKPIRQTLITLYMVLKF